MLYCGLFLFRFWLFYCLRVYLLRCGWFEVYCCLLVVIGLFGCGLYMSVLVGLLFGSLVLVGLWLV